MATENRVPHLNVHGSVRGGAAADDFICPDRHRDYVRRLFELLEGVDVELLLLGIRELLHVTEESDLGSFTTRGSKGPYRQWFHEDEPAFTTCMAIRVALGMEVPEDVDDVVPVLVERFRTWGPPGGEEEGDDEEEVNA